MTKTPEELAREYANETGELSEAIYWRYAHDGFLDGYKAGHAAGVESTHKIYDAVREHLETEMFVQHEPLLKKYSKDK